MGVLLLFASRLLGRVGPHTQLAKTAMRIRYTLKTRLSLSAAARPRRWHPSTNLPR
jgi:hypothetical protein